GIGFPHSSVHVRMNVGGVRMKSIIKGGEKLLAPKHKPFYFNKTPDKVGSNIACDWPVSLFPRTSETDSFSSPDNAQTIGSLCHFLPADPRLFSTIASRPRYWDSIRQSYRPTMTIAWCITQNSQYLKTCSAHQFGDS
uniref:hypothetical protein n=1 Tax=Collinsella aerofaciens TaxID=74426 RepID=UPI00359C86D9